ncbi:hypothetical protein Pan216_28220 [Planctomycetes bacterium Pan216]|uniref:DUF4280 domain-containing protein n=1 Tax=Kolteria novifilia TaxID=2527975 RepID=A0A518B4U0_9BACT|nr:hypothetical protein Pan216_28220 [Planctomycetes bacterium Pan216]
MSQIVCHLDQCVCTFGTVPQPLMATTQTFRTINGSPVATINDGKALVNIISFGTCTKLTAQNNGVPTPCMPVIPAPWTPGSTVDKVNGIPVLTQPSTLTCSVGGMITVSALVANATLARTV